MDAKTNPGCAAQTVRCVDCGLRKLPVFKPLKPHEIAFIDKMKQRDDVLEAGATIIAPGADSAELYTLYGGWAFRYKMMSDGRRQILHFIMPGDLIGLQAAMFDAADHGVEALTRVHLCVLPRREVWSVYREMPHLAFDVTWLGAREENLVDDSLLSAGRRTADERVAALLIGLYKRARALGLVEGASVHLPLTQQHIADALGLSLVHTNKTLAKLRRYGLFARNGGRFTMLNVHALQRLAEYADREMALRPLI